MHVLHVTCDDMCHEMAYFRQVSFETKVNLEGRKARKKLSELQSALFKFSEVKGRDHPKENHYLINLVSFYLSLYDFSCEM